MADDHRENFKERLDGLISGFRTGWKLERLSEEFSAFSVSFGTFDLEGVEDFF